MCMYICVHVHVMYVHACMHLVEQLDIRHLLLEGELVEVCCHGSSVVLVEVLCECLHQVIHGVDLVQYSTHHLG